MLEVGKTIGVALTALVLAGCASLADRVLNGVRLSPPYEASLVAEHVHQQLTIVDLHADTMLWNRDLLDRSSYGHVDLPRLVDGHMALQVFGVVTKVPLFLKLEGNTDSPDVVSVLSRAQGWPEPTRCSVLERALYQANKLKERVGESSGGLRLIANQQELDGLLAARDRGEVVVGAMLGLEGAHALEGDVSNLDRLYDHGFRLLGLTHFFDNEMAGSAHGVHKGGLTTAGRELVVRAQERGMLIDLAHASPQAIDDALTIAEKPVIVSHTGVRSTCDTPRNLSDPQVRGIAATFVVIGIGLFKYATCGEGLEDTVKAMRYVADLVGVEHVALGSDFDGATTVVVDSSGLVLLTEALLESGFTEEDVAAILGGNALRVLREGLPET